ncbi:MAG TPA: hypothetical protein VFQ61_23300 [Polyangiaceae bacterium]|nr:hypothetical protein [Polyangiaceae bacterium]
MRLNPEEHRPWWYGDALGVGASGLELDGHPLTAIAAEHGTPTYVYGLDSVRRRIRELRAALGAVGAPGRIHYAVKANRCRALLEVIREEGLGIDACSPREVALALEVGFTPEQISVTAGMLSNRDLEAFARAHVHLNLDTRSALRRWSEIAGPAERGVGIRLDPGVRVGWGEHFAYGVSKFGFPIEQALEIVELARSLGLEVDTLHVHAGWGLKAEDEARLAHVFEQIAELSAHISSLHTINVGGGLGGRLRGEEQPLSLERWAALLRGSLGATGLGIACEPGTYIAASAGVLIAEVNTVELRRSVKWYGLDVGSAVNVYAAYYGLPLEILSLRDPLCTAGEPAHVAGNINEPNDVFARARPLPRFREGELVGIYPAGAYGASMASDHCMRGAPAEVAL